MGYRESFAKNFYLHLKKFDPQSKRGGFKFFSRSIDYHKVHLFANLVMTITQKNDVQNFFAELEKMHLLRNEASLLHYRDISTYVGYNQKNLRRKVAFQSELFAGDLVQMPKEWNEGKQLAKGLLDAVQALQDLHRYQVFHRDLKPGNFFVRQHSNLSSLVLADFGLSQHLGEEKFCHTIAGTRGYIAPELCRANYETGRPCTSWAEVAAADTFSLGMTFYTILMGRDNLYKREVTTLNEIALPRKNVPTPSKQLSIPEALEAVETAYQEVLKRTEDSNAGDSYRREVLKLVGRAIAPKPEQRISLEQLKVELGKL
jgi:serine/threonine protein kinase